MTDIYLNLELPLMVFLRLLYSFNDNNKRSSFY
jgi:hypothetical protein